MGSTITDKSLEKVFNIVSVLACVGIAIPELSKVMDSAFVTLDSGGNFVMCYVPVFSSIMAAGGGITSSAIYSVTIIGVTEIFVSACKSILYPLVPIMMAMGITEGLNPGVSLSGFTTACKKVVTFSLTLIMTLFVGLISMQSFAGTAADTLTMKAAKLVASNFIPVVGGAISDAYGTVRASFGVLRSGVGIFGVIAVCVIILPPLLADG